MDNAFSKRSLAELVAAHDSKVCHLADAAFACLTAVGVLVAFSLFSNRFTVLRPYILHHRKVD